MYYIVMNSTGGVLLEQAGSEGPTEWDLIPVGLFVYLTAKTEIGENCYISFEPFTGDQLRTCDPLTPEEQEDAKLQLTLAP